MSKVSPMQKLVDEIRQVYAADHLRAEAGIETYLESRLRSLPANKKMVILEKLTKEFNDSSSTVATNSTTEEEVLSKVFSLVLGGKVAKADISSTELLQRLAQSLNTIFDRLNQLVGLINSTFHSQSSGEETIRQVIGLHLKSEDQLKSLESYLGQINKAFLIAQQASKNAAYRIVGQILQELDPEKISREAEGGLKFGPLRKAELYDVFVQKIEKCRQWYKSDRFSQDLQREFEKSCRPETR